MFLICFVMQGKDVILSAYYVLPPAQKFSVYYCLNIFIYTVSTASKHVRVYVGNNKTHGKDFPLKHDHKPQEKPKERERPSRIC